MRSLLWPLLLLSLASCERPNLTLLWQKLIQAEQRVADTHLATGPIGGNYALFGEELKRTLDRQEMERPADLFKLNLVVESSLGSVQNLENLLAGDLHVALVQSDRLLEAWQGEQHWKKSGARTVLRSILVPFTEELTLLARTQSSITQISDLRGKRINLGPEDSGQFATAATLLQLYKMGRTDLQISYLAPLDAFTALKENRIDALFTVISHPSGSLKELSNEVGLTAIPIVGEEVSFFVQKFKAYHHSFVPIAFYPLLNNNRNVPTLGLHAVITTTQMVDAEQIYRFTKMLFQGLEELKTNSPLLHKTTLANIFQGLTVPLHPGAIKFYREAGLSAQIPTQFLENSR